MIIQATDNEKKQIKEYQKELDSLVFKCFKSAYNKIKTKQISLSLRADGEYSNIMLDDESCRQIADIRLKPYSHENDHVVFLLEYYKKQIKNAKEFLNQLEKI